MASQVGLTVVKRFSYRGDASEEYSNTYHLTGDVPADAAAWRTLFDALVVVEKACYDAGTTVVRGYGYDSDADDATAVWSVDLTVSPNTPVAGTLTVTGAKQAPGDCAVWARWKTSRLNTKGKPIYLRKYFHPAFGTGAGSADNVIPAQTTALNALGLKLQDGTFADARTITARGHVDTIVNHGASSWTTTRTLKRRGKRPGA
jgi:hypothetical protein